MDKYIGKMLDNRYEIIEVIGVGGMAVVYKARCHRLNRLVAVKILKDDYAQDADFRRRFHAESQAVAMLSHPNIVSVFDVSRNNETEYIVMELIDGITLKQYMQKKGVLNWREALHFVTQIVKALSHAHSRGIIHRDIKPHNIMILRDGSVKVADFGIARFASKQNTLTQEALGSVHYISPEQARGSHIDARSDIYSVGVVLYEMLTARLPYEGDSPVSVAIQHISSVPLSPKEINQDIPDALEMITMKAMTGQLSKRYSSAEVMLRDLEEFRKNPSISFDYNIVDLRPADDDVDEPTRSITGGEAGAAVAEARNQKKKQKAVEEKNRLRKEILEEENNKTRKSNSSIMILTGVLGVLVFIAAMGFLAFNMLGDIFDSSKVMVTVPDFRNEVFDAEVFADKYPNLNFDPVVKQNDKYDENVIYAQDPVPQKEVVEGSTIRLTISSGPTEITLPDFTNHNYVDVQMKLVSLGLNYASPSKYDVSNDVTRDCVIMTEPAAGETVFKGDRITLVISLGPEIVKKPVPGILGLDENEARIMLEEAGMTVGTVTPVESDTPAGQVVRQSIEKDVMVDENTPVDFDVSLGPQEEPSPSPTVTVIPPEQPPGEEVTPSAEPDDPGDSVPVTTPQLVTVIKDIKLPQDRAVVNVRIVLGTQEMVNRDVNVASENGVLSVSLTGYPTDIVTVYFDDVPTFNETLMK